MLWYRESNVITKYIAFNYYRRNLNFNTKTRNYRCSPFLPTLWVGLCTTAVWYLGRRVAPVDHPALSSVTPSPPNTWSSPPQVPTAYSNHVMLQILHGDNVMFANSWQRTQNALFSYRQKSCIKYALISMRILCKTFDVNFIFYGDMHGMYVSDCGWSGSFFFVLDFIP